MATVIRHGTSAGYQQHILRKVPLCQPCRDARSAYMASYKAARAAVGRPQEAAPATRLPTEAIDTVALALELELGGRANPQALRWAAVIALRTALAVLDADRRDPGMDGTGSGGVS